MIRVEYCHFKSDKRTGTRNRVLLSIFEQLPGFKYDLYDEDWQTFAKRVESQSSIPRILLWHYTPICENRGWPKQKLSQLKLSHSDSYILCVSGAGMTGTEKNLKLSISTARELKFGGFSWSNTGLDEVNAYEFFYSFFSRVEQLLSGSKRKLGFEEFELAVNPPRNDFIHDCIQKLVRVASLDLNRHGLFATKLFERMQLDKSIVDGLSLEKSRGLVDFISNLAEFERCRTSLAHSALNDFLQAIRIVRETKTNPNEFPFSSDPDCVDRLVSFLKRGVRYPCMINETEAMFRSAKIILNTVAIQEVLSELSTISPAEGRSCKPFIRSASIENALDNWEQLESALNAFPKRDGKQDKDWISETSLSTLNMASEFAEKYQEAITRKHFYEETT